MPIVVDRRSFLKTGAQLAAAGMLGFRGLSAASPELRIALFSDTHIAADPTDQFRGFFPHQNLTKAVAQAKEAHFDLLVVNGDLARKQGLPEDYGQFTRLIDPLADSGPMAVTMGNHDDRVNARKALSKRAGDVEAVVQKLVTTLDAGDFRLVFLDSLMVTNVTQGLLGHSQREWLTGYLDAQKDKPMIVFVHHNPDPDSDTGLMDAERLLNALRPRIYVKALIFGHTHTYRFSQLDRLHLINLPAVGYNFADGEVIGWLDGRFSASGAHLQLHALGGDPSADGRMTDLAWR